MAMDIVHAFRSYMPGKKHKEELFKHEPLDHRKPSIRLIQVRKALSADGMIQCEMLHSTIEASYTCLSYVWGPSERGHMILVNGKPFFIRANLFDFLTIARQKLDGAFDSFYGNWPTRSILWIDALCIDQQNISERNHQVQQMGKIFSHASEVLIWLGMDKGEVPNYVWVLLREGLKNGTSYWTNLHGRTRSEIKSRIFHNLYWSRAWVTQEIMLARRATALIGDQEVSWCSLVALYKTYPDRNSYPYTYPFEPYSVTDIGNPFTHLRGASLVWLLRHFSNMQCSVARDRAFSLLSLCGEGNELVVDYSLPEIDLIFEILSCCRSCICICSAAFLLQKLGPATDVALNPVSHAPYLYLEIDIVAHLGKGSLIVLSNDEKSIPRSARNFKINYQWGYTCSGRGNPLTLWWKELESPEEKVIVWGEVWDLEKLQVKKRQLCTYGHGVEIIKQAGEGSGETYTVRVAFSILAHCFPRIVPNEDRGGFREPYGGGAYLCEFANTKSTSHKKRPRVGCISKSIAVETRGGMIQG